MPRGIDRFEEIMAMLAQTGLTGASSAAALDKGSFAGSGGVGKGFARVQRQRLPGAIQEAARKFKTEQKRQQEEDKKARNIGRTTGGGIGGLDKFTADVDRQKLFNIERRNQDLLSRDQLNIQLLLDKIMRARDLSQERQRFQSIDRLLSSRGGSNDRTSTTTTQQIFNNAGAAQRVPITTTTRESGNRADDIASLLRLL